MCADSTTFPACRMPASPRSRRRPEGAAAATATAIGRTPRVGKLADNLFVLKPGGGVNSGGNTAVFVTGNG
jgi:hypothetical protein